MIGAVLTGDIVASSSMSEDALRRVREIVLGSVEAINSWEKDAVSGKPDFFRGDSWQLLLRNPQYLLRASLLIRSRLLATGAADTRVAIGVGTVSEIDESKISLSSGEAFSLSGHALDKMKDERMVLAMAPAFSEISDFAAAVVRVCDAMVSGWTARQAEITGIALEAGMEFSCGHCFKACTAHYGARRREVAKKRALRRYLCFALCIRKKPVAGEDFMKPVLVVFSNETKNGCFLD